MMPLRCLSMAALLSCSVLPALAEDGPPATSPGVPAGPPYSSLLIQPADRGFDVALEMCFVTMTGPPVTEASARRYVPAEYALARDAGPQIVVDEPSADTASQGATVAVWDFACDLAAVPGGAPGPARLSFVAVHISHPGRDLDAYAGVPPNLFPHVWSHYVVWAQTDNPAIAGHPREEGVPIELVDDFGFRSRADRDDIAVASRISPYRVTNNAQVDDVVFGPHDHANEFWFGAGPHAAVLKVRIHDAHDLDCVPTVQPGCRGEIAAPAGGVVAELLGSPRVVTRWALRHHKVPVVNARVDRARP